MIALNTASNFEGEALRNCVKLINKHAGALTKGDMTNAPFHERRGIPSPDTVRELTESWKRENWKPPVWMVKQKKVKDIAFAFLYAGFRDLSAVDYKRWGFEPAITRALSQQVKLGNLTTTRGRMRNEGGTLKQCWLYNLPESKPITPDA